MRVRRECSLELEQSKPPRLSFSVAFSLRPHRLPLPLSSSLFLCSMNPRGISSRNITHRAPRLPVSLFHPSSLCTTTFASCTRPSKPSRGLRWQPLHPSHATLSPFLRILRRILWSLPKATIFFLFLQRKKRRLYIDRIVTTSTHDFT